MKYDNDTFHPDGIQSVSARDYILREIISNLLMHRDFSSGYIAKLVIEKERILTENANLSHGHGVLQLASFDPFQKNPPISKVFREIGLADELGSGMRNTYKYTKMYSGAEPEFIEGDVFRIIIPLAEIATATVGPKGTGTQADTQGDTQTGTQGGAQNNSTEKIANQIYEMVKENPHITRKEMADRLGIGIRTVLRIIKKMDTIKYIGSGYSGHWEIIIR